MTGEDISIIAGFVLGILIAGYALVYAPMKANYERGGCVWLHCEPAQ